VTPIVPLAATRITSNPDGPHIPGSTSPSWPNGLVWDADARLHLRALEYPTPNAPSENLQHTLRSNSTCGGRQIGDH